MHKIYTQTKNELLPNTLRNCDMLDAVTPSIPSNAVIADVALPAKQANQAYQVSGAKNSDGYYTVSNNVSVVDDYRNVDTYHTETGEKEAVTELGDLPSHLTTEPRPSPAHIWQSNKWVIDKAKQTELEAQERKALTQQIDAAVAAIYAQYEQFGIEYRDREAQAQSYKDAGYNGTVPKQVDAFAKPANKTAKQATDIILQQSALLRGALDNLGVLRMRKYEVINAPDIAAARAASTEILAAIQQIGAAL